MYEPLYRHRPSHRRTHGDLAAKVGADIGLPPDPEQQWILDSIYAERTPDRPASFEVAVIGPRQPQWSPVVTTGTTARRIRAA